MSIVLADNHVVIPQRANWGAQKPRATRRWQTEIASGITGGEDRQANALLPWRGIEFVPTTKNTEDTADLLARLNLALQAGKAAVPLWSRASALTVAASGTTLVLAPGAYTWAIGDWLFLHSGTRWLARKVIEWSGSPGAGYTLVVASLGLEFPVGTHVHRMILGMPTVEEVGARSPDHANVRLRVEEPRGVGERLEPSCGAVVCVEGTGAFNVCPGPALTIGGEEGCPVKRRLSWRPLEGAADYRVWRAESATGPWTDITDDLDLNLDTETGEWWALVQLPYYRGEASTLQYYSLTAVIGDNTIRGRVRSVAKNRIERVMRAVQDRRHTVILPDQISGTIEEFIPWPSRAYPATSNPTNYPVDGFYDAELQSWDAANAQLAGTRFAQLVRACCDGFVWGYGTRNSLHTGYYDWIGGGDDLRSLYGVGTPITTMEGLDNERFPPCYYVEETEDKPAGSGWVQLTVDTSAVTAATATARLTECLDLLCLLNTYIFQEQATVEARIGGGYGSEDVDGTPGQPLTTYVDDNCAAAEAEGEAEWDAYGWQAVGAGELYIVAASGVGYDGTVDVYFPTFLLMAQRGKGTFDLRYTPRGASMLYAQHVAWPVTTPGVHAQAPHFLADCPGLRPHTPANPTSLSQWLKCQSTGETPLLGLVWDTRLFGDQSDWQMPAACQLIGGIYNEDETTWTRYGWAVRWLVVVVQRSGDAANAGTGTGWDHYA